MYLIDLSALKRAVPLSRVLSLMGYVRMDVSRTRFRGYCPLRCGAASRCCGFDMAKSIWHCFACGKAGNQLDLWMLHTRLSVYQASVDLCYKAGVEVPFLPQTLAPCLREPKRPEDN